MSDKFHDLDTLACLISNISIYEIEETGRIQIAYPDPCGWYQG